MSDHDTYSELHTAFSGRSGENAAHALALAGKIFLDAPLAGDVDCVRHNFAKEILRKAGFTLRLVQSHQPYRDDEEPEGDDQ